MPPVCAVPLTSTIVLAPPLSDVAERDRHASPFTNPGRPWPSTVNGTTCGSILSRDRHRAFVGAGDRGHADRDRGLVAIDAVGLEALTSRDARRDRRGIHHQRPDAVAAAR